MSKFCMHCGAALQPGQKFCGKCGTAVTSNDSAQEAAEAEATLASAGRARSFGRITWPWLIGAVAVIAVALALGYTGTQRWARTTSQSKGQPASGPSNTSADVAPSPRVPGQSSDLDRRTALTILQKDRPNSEPIRTGISALTVSIPDFASALAVHAHGAGQNAYIVWGGGATIWQRDDQDRAAGQLSCLRLLAGGGYFHAVNDRETRERLWSQNMNLTDATVEVAWHTFAPTENTYVRQIAPGQFELDLTTSSFRGVSGISQEGGRAIVEAEIDVKLTPVYEGMTKIVQGQKCQSLWRVGAGGGEMGFARWPQSVNGGTQKGSYRFQRFDDGWRVVGR